ncbi:MAG: AAA family ATPase [Candidatus Omnitrophica bacterium]|nr:AAA family ATPase [Candidatus Omnitrophota bacterium]
MSYYQLLGLTQEPFSTSPDPSFFFKSTSHRQALHRLEIAIRLRRGLSLILGDVGTGKTTLARTLMNAFRGEDDQFLFYLILDPTYDSEFQFLSTLTKLFGAVPAFKSTLDHREAIERCLFQRGVEEQKTIILVIDEGQKLTPSMLEALRVLLNYETNDYKLLQLAIFGQMELLPRVTRIRNFVDRAALKYIVNPLDEAETGQLIRFRLTQAGLPEGRELFTSDAVKAIYAATQGYPRRIALLCHNALELAVMHDAPKVDGGMMADLIKDEVRWRGGEGIFA